MPVSFLTWRGPRVFVTSGFWIGNRLEDDSSDGIALLRIGDVHEVLRLVPAIPKDPVRPDEAPHIPKIVP